MAITVPASLRCLRVGLAGQHEDLAHVGNVLLALFDGFGVGAGVVVALRQAQTAGAIEQITELESA